MHLCLLAVTYASISIWTATNHHLDSAHAAPVEMTNVTGHSSVNGTTTSVNEKSTVM